MLFLPEHRSLRYFEFASTLPAPRCNPPDHAVPPHRGTAPAPPGELEKRYIEAKDNVKFLATLERHFKHILHGSLLQIIDTLPSMMNALRMVWVISRHYKDDQRMEPLFGRIG